jgi:ElaB/YqjD/DUF883 family membrane-anchored ribosome-binding protein
MENAMDVTEQWAAECTINAARNQDDLFRRPLKERLKMRMARLADRLQHRAATNANQVHAYIVREPSKSLLVAAVLGVVVGSLVKRQAG